jgi:hypothetical protein
MSTTAGEVAEGCVSTLSGVAAERQAAKNNVTASNPRHRNTARFFIPTSSTLAKAFARV